MRPSYVHLIDQVLTKLFSYFPDYKGGLVNSLSHGIVQGEVGMVLLCAFMYDLTNDPKYRQWAHTGLMILITKSKSTELYALGNGLAGLAYQ